jgi:pyruvate kinase
MGAYPDKALGVLRSVALRMEEWLRQEKFGGVLLPQIASTSDGRVSEEVSGDAFAARGAV